LNASKVKPVQCICCAGRYILAGKEPTSATSATAAPSDDDTSTIENGVTFLNFGKGTPTAKQTARSDINAAVGRLGSPTSRAQVCTEELDGYQKQ
jgi:hypothetical protein